LKFAIRNYLVLFVGCAAFHVVGTWSLPLIDRDEPRFAEASREMIQRSDYVVPYFNNQLRLDKPPLAYWAQVASYRIFGANDFAARLPSPIAAALVALSIFAWGVRLGGERIGWWAAIVFTLSLQTFIHGKAAVADMWLVLFFTLAHWAGYELLRDRLTNSQDSISNIEVRSRPWWWIFYFSLALGFLAKGPIGWIPLLTVGWTIFCERDFRLAKRFKPISGGVLVVLLDAIWAVPALVRTHGQFFTVGIGRHVLARSFGVMDEHGGTSLGMYFLLLPFYVVTIFVSFFPWSIKLPYLVRKLRTGRGSIDNYLLAGMTVTLLIFTLIRTKLPHYILPAMPLLSLMFTRHVINQPRFLRAAAMTSACSYVVLALVAAPLLAPSFPVVRLFEMSRESLRPGMEFGAVKFTEPSLVWYFRSRVNGWMTWLAPEDALRFMHKIGPRFVVLPTKFARQIFVDHPADWKMYSAHGLNIAKGRSVDLTLVLKPE
jgi:4-amino-4-deoxy-L-arabinose transferase-like glycosyltransferase